MGLREISFDEIEVGQVVRLHCRGGYTLQGRVNFLEDGGRAVRMGEGYYRVLRWRGEVVRVELLAAPLAVGDEVTEENKHLLPELFAMIDCERTLWTCWPGGYVTPRAPFRLVYIHAS